MCKLFLPLFLLILFAGCKTDPSDNGKWSITRSGSLPEAVFIEDFNKNIPMDLRGIANIDDSLKYVIGGIAKGQRTSQDIIKLEWKE